MSVFSLIIFPFEICHRLCATIHLPCASMWRHNGITSRPSWKTYEDIGESFKWKLFRFSSSTVFHLVQRDASTGCGVTISIRIFKTENLNAVNVCSEWKRWVRYQLFEVARVLNSLSPYNSSAMANAQVWCVWTSGTLYSNLFKWIASFHETVVYIMLVFKYLNHWAISVCISKRFSFSNDYSLYGAIENCRYDFTHNVVISDL